MIENDVITCAEAHRQLFAAEVEIAKLRSALVFYAEADNHLQKFGQPITAIPVWQDAGSRAREALGLQ